MKCGEKKPESDYYLEKGRPRSSCKECHKAAVYARRDADPEAAKAYMGAWREKNRDRLREQARERRKEKGEYWNRLRREARAREPERYRKVQREYRAKNRERVNAVTRARYELQNEYIRAQMRDYRKRNPERVREWDLTSRERHRDKKNEYQREYYKKNPEVFERGRAKRRARLANVEHSPYTRREIYDRDGGTCRGCEKALPFEPNGFQIDHIVPISLGGPDTWANVQLMCPTCNREKWNRLEGQIPMPV